MNQSQKQKLFPLLVAELITEMYHRGYQLAVGEAWRPPEMAKIYAAQGIGITNSLHWNRLAIDLCLYKDGIYLTKTQDYKEMGEYWKSLSGEGYLCVWGGEFGDGNHFSIENNGVR